MLKRKECSEEGCIFPAWAKGKCQSHGEKRGKLKSGGVSVAKRERSANLKVLFQEIWEDIPQPRRCFETNAFLPSEPATTMFHHVLEKSVYPEYTYAKWNIVVILPDVHAQVHSNIDKTPKIKELRSSLLNSIHNGTIQ